MREISPHAGQEELALPEVSGADKIRAGSGERYNGEMSGDHSGDSVVEAREGTSWTIKGVGDATLLAERAIPPHGLFFGRLADNDVVLDQPDYPGVSGRHARVFLEGSDLILEDLDSRNGTLVQGRPTRRRALRHGEVFQLGPRGPLFLVNGPNLTDETAIMEATNSGFHRLGTRTMFALRRTLGIPEGVDVEELVERRSRNNLRTSVVIAVALILASGVIYWGWQASDSRSLAALRADLDSARRDAAEQRLEFDRRQKHFEAERTELAEHRQALLQQIARVNDQGVNDARQLEELEARLNATDRRLELFDPVNLEQEKLALVAEVEDAVVLIESALRYRDPETGRILYSRGGGRRLNLEGKGEPFEEASSGSGFCVSPEGWIVTNAHVVMKTKEPWEDIELSATQTVVPFVELWVTFSRSTKRHRGELVDWVRGDRQDLALVRIEPFEGMPSLKEFHIESESPSLGTDVFLLGFPLGKEILQEGNRVVASTFRGIVSRTVDYYVQVDAAVHHGVSGGPVIDGKGQLIGVVTGMQALDSPEGSSAIGYVIPTRELEAIWPPR